MSSFENRSSDLPAHAGSAEETLRLIAKLQAPDGLAERVQASLRNAPQTAGTLSWPSIVAGRGWRHTGAFRSAAAAAIVCVVAGGGWTISSRMPPAMAPAAKVARMPARTGNTGGFSSANAIRTPRTLDRPVLTHTPTRQQDDDPKSAAVQAPSLKGKSSTKARRAASAQSGPAIQ